MEMKKVVLAMMVVAASISMAAAGIHMATPAHDASAAPGPAPEAAEHAGAFGAFPSLGSVVGASLMTLVAYYYN